MTIQVLLRPIAVVTMLVETDASAAHTLITASWSTLVVPPYSTN